MNPAPVLCASCRRELSAAALFCPNCGTPRTKEGVVDELVGAVLGERFLVTDRLGAGKSGIIYRGEHVTLRRKVAIKVLHHELSRDDLAIERFRREATSVAEIDNEHIVEIHDFGRTSDGRLYLAMELLEGETLDIILAREGSLAIDRAIDILIQVGEALVDAHAVGFVHRDLRPRNIFLSVRRGKANFVKLLDFGLSKLVEGGGVAASTSLGMTFGDPRYMSPEQAKGDAIDRRADLYSLGCIACEMLTGEPPFVGGKVFDVLTRHVNERPASVRGKRPDVPLWLDAAIARTLAKAPGDRFVTAAKLVEVLRGAGAVPSETGPVAVLPGPGAAPITIPPPTAGAPASAAVPGALIPPSPSSGPNPNPSLNPNPNPSPTPNPSPSLNPNPSPNPTANPNPNPNPTPNPIVAQEAVPVAVPSSLSASGSVTESGRRGPTGTPAVGIPAVDPATLPPPASAPTATPPIGAPITPPPPERAHRESSPPERAHRESSPPERAHRESNPPPSASERLSIPMAAVDAPSGPTEAAVETTDRVRRLTGPTAASSSRSRRISQGEPNLSGAWFADGDGALDESGAASLQRARGFIDPGDSLLDDDYRRPRRTWKPFAIAGGVAAAAILAIILFGGGKSKSADKPPEVAQPAVDVDAAVAPLAGPLDAGIEAVVDAAAVTPTPPTTIEHGGGAGSAVKPPVDRPPPVDRVTITPGGGSGSSRTFDDPTRVPGGGSGSAVVEPGSGSAAPSTDEQAQLAEFYAKAGDAALHGGDPVSAASNYQKALAANPKNVDAVIGLGEVAVAQGVYADALRQLKKAAKLAPRSARVHTLLGEAYLNTGNATAAEQSFKKALQLDPDNARARNGYNEAAGRLPPPTDDP